MERFIKPTRIGLLAFLMAILVAVYSLTLYRLQIIDGAGFVEDSARYVSTTKTIHAARGSILDRNGVLLVSDKTVYDVRISRSQLLQQENPNDIILKLVRAASEYGVAYEDSFPVTISAPFEYYANATTTQQSRLTEYFRYFSNMLHIEDPENPDISATELISWMREHYGIDYSVTAEDARRIIGIRYELEIRVIVNTTDYVFARRIPNDFLTYISEQNLPSVSIEARSEREYHTSYAAHLLGHVGDMTRDQYENIYRELGYPLNSQVGQEGVEAAFERYLHGTDGRVTVYTDASGATTDMVVNSEAAAGGNVYLTIDINLQEAAENALASTIAQMNRDRIAAAAEKNAGLPEDEAEEAELAEGGAVVAIDIKNGDVLAMASYPTFDLSNYSRDYASLASDSLNPLWNRSTSGLYNPGSTFKLVTALAALRSGTISRWTRIEDKVIYTKYEDLHYTPTCWSPVSHGFLDVVGAIEQSCNYFFYTVADEMGIDIIAETAQEFGFGSPTGIEIEESAGLVASRETKREQLNEGWWSADTLIACIGQSLNLFTPIQIANYTATIANGGTHYSTTILKYITSFDYSDIIFEREPEVLNVIDDRDGYIPILQEGMRAVAKTGTASSALADYPIPVAAKTGTVQSDTSTINDGVFICFAPADDPQIAIAVVVEKGGSGSALITIAKDLLDVYFSSSEAADSVHTDNSLLK